MPWRCPTAAGSLVGGFHDLSWNLYRYPGRLRRPAGSLRLDSRSGRPASGPGRRRRDTATGAPAGEPYRRRLTLDVAAGDAVFVPGYGGAQGVAFLMSDLLGDNLLFGSVGSFQGRRLGSSARQHQRHRGLPQSVSGGSTGASEPSAPRGRNFEGDRVVAYEETADGALGLLRYPLSRFSRIEGTAVVEHSDRVDFTLPVDQPRRVGWIASHYLSFVHDNSLWIPSGPIDGEPVQPHRRVSSDFIEQPLRQLPRSAATGADISGLGKRSAWAVARLRASTAAATGPAGSTSAAPSACGAIPSSATSSARGHSCSTRSCDSRC